MNDLIKNEHGIKGVEVYDIHMPPGKLLFIPECCMKCKNMESEFSEWSMASTHYCIKDVFLLTQKGTCKKQDPY